ncbi:MAG: glycosyltransferase [Candidatus Latescibacteria bacterium]|nr:glycosyltransferase [Candidatus Latescibacterota bacterium]NIM22416.1 glycosyltransferase [Candidatus Latescibacterota bacterium]NIM64776.1 glycosyltransferase [Candidatus Latescibacterota bacterium]NIO01287.1 glycosyltransferase [Candidatus Latescibacterota bacterium]NIO27779.1 glycosyltransferase [Candidatus Latescibacterota bacterium]
MRVLMLGWEFPPFISGGLGTACRGLTDAMRRLETRILFVLPRSIESQEHSYSSEEVESPDGMPRSNDTANVSEHPAGEVELSPVQSEITNPYRTATPHRMNTSTRSAEIKKRAQEVRIRRAGSSSVRVMGVGAEDGYDGDLLQKTHAYADRCAELTRRELFDVIHAHDWMTFPAAIRIAAFSGRPLVVHLHATEFDRSGEWINRSVFDIERCGMHAATRVIAVSERTKQIIVQRYGVPAEKVVVVHNGIDFNPLEETARHNGRREKTVLFLGRITMQKGPEYFVRAAARVAEWMDKVRFVVAGKGDQLPFIIGLANELGLGDRVEFAGFLHGADVDRAYRTADVFAMPSVSEPFGLTALEAARHGVPVIMSKSSGVAEVLRRGALKVDFWDVELMAKMIVSVLKYPHLAETLRRESAAEIRGLTWDAAARKCISSYYDALKHSSDGSRSLRVEDVQEELTVVSASN